MDDDWGYPHDSGNLHLNMNSVYSSEPSFRHGFLQETIKKKAAKAEPLAEFEDGQLRDRWKNSQIGGFHKWRDPKMVGL